jgi:hypothetical protein
MNNHINTGESVHKSKISYQIEQVRLYLPHLI